MTEASSSAVVCAGSATFGLYLYRRVGPGTVLHLPEPEDRALTLMQYAYPTISPCGLRLAFSSRGPQGLAVNTMYMDGSILQSFGVQRWPFYYLWSPDSRYLTWLGSSETGVGIGLRVRP